MLQFKYAPSYEKFNVINNELQLLAIIKTSFCNKPHVEIDCFK
jgi:hypothetical protein